MPCVGNFCLGCRVTRVYDMQMSDDVLRVLFKISRILTIVLIMICVSPTVIGSVPRQNETSIDDFYNYVNSDWINNTIMPENAPVVVSN